MKKLAILLACILAGSVATLAQQQPQAVNPAFWNIPGDLPGYCNVFDLFLWTQTAPGTLYFCGSDGMAHALSGSSGGSLTIGSAVGGGTNNEALYVGPSGLLAQSAVALPTSPDGSIIFGGTWFAPTGQVSTTTLNATYPQLATANAYAPLQEFQPSSLYPGIYLVCGSKPTAILSYADGIYCTPAGVLVYGDGTNVHYAATFKGTGPSSSPPQPPGSPPVTPVTGHLASVASDFSVADAGIQLVSGTVPLVSGSPSTATVSGMSPAFTSTSTYSCQLTAEAAATSPLYFTKVSGSSFTITGPNTVTTVIDYSCSGQ